MKVKDIFFAFLILAYLIASSAALSIVSNLLEPSPLLIFLCAIFGVAGAITIFSIALKKLCAAKRKDERLRWYSTPSFTFGCALCIYGSIALWPAFRLVLPHSTVGFKVFLFLEGISFLTFFFFLVLAFFYGRKEREVS